MRILNVVWGPFPDIRLVKTGRLLGEAGHTVDVLCLTARGGDWPWGEVIEAPLPQSIPLRAWYRLAYQVRRDPTLFAWRHRQALIKVLARRRYDAIQWNDLPGLDVAVEAAHAHGARLVFDMHENYADNMWSTERDLGARSWAYDMNAWLAYEGRAVSAADHVLVNIEEMGQRLTGMHGIDRSRITPVRNAEPPDHWRAPSRDAALVERFKDKLVLSFISSCSRHRGMDVIIRALPKVLVSAPSVETVIVGDGNGLPDWRALGVEERVHFEGRVPFARALQFYAISDIGLIPHHKYAQTDNGIPHKFAQILMAGIPVLVSSCHALERLTRQLDCGEVFAAGDPDAAAAAILRLTDRERRRRLGANGKAAATDGLMSWRQMGEDIQSAYAKAFA